MIQFYAPDIRESLFLGEDESIHCARVLRKRPGDTIFVTDGRGSRFKCVISAIVGKRVNVEIEEAETVPKSWKEKITLAVAPTKNADRMAWLVEKSTEIGVDEIIFLRCRHNERKDVNIERLRRNAISAMNQSLKTRLPEVKGLVTVKELCDYKGQGYFGYCSPEIPRVSFADEFRPDSAVCIAIGPEGDFSGEEVEILSESGFKAITFGEERLRTETAALYGVTAIHVIDDCKQIRI